MNQSISKRMILVTVILMDLLSGMEFDLFVPSFPQLQAQFSLTPFLVELLLSVNFAGYCLSLIFVGGLADSYGRKPIITLGLMTFVIGSLLCLWSPFYSVLLAGRFLQGAGIAAPAILSFLIIADSYPLKQQQFLMGVLNGAMNIGVGVAPVIGSYLTLYFNWQGNFTVLLTLGLITLLMALLFIPLVVPEQHDELISLRGVNGYLTILKTKPLMLLMTNLLLLFIPYWIFVGMSPLLYMKDLGVSLTHFGYYQGVLAFVFAIGSILFGLYLKEAVHSQQKITRTAILIVISSFLMITAATIMNSASPMFITLAILLFVIGQIIPSTLLYPLCINFLPHAKARVSSMMQGMRLILTSISLQIAGYFYNGSFRNIGIIICAFILMSIISYLLVLRNKEIMRFLQD